MAERPFHDAFLAKRVPCEVCYRQKKEIKFFLREGGADHHFRTMHKQRFGEEMQRKCEELMKRKHGEETLVYIDTLMKRKAEKVLRKFTTHFKSGDAYNATVLNVNKDSNSLELSLIGNPADRLKKNGIVVGKVSKILSNAGLLIKLPFHKCGFAHVTELHDEYRENPLQSFKTKMFVRCCVLSVKDDSHIDLSLRPSRTLTEDSNKLKVVDRQIAALEDIHEGDILRGYIKSCSDVGVFVSLSSKIVGRVQIRNLSQYFVKNWKELFTVGKLVKAKVLKIDPASNHIDLSLRGKDVDGPDPAPPPKRKKEDKETKSKKFKSRDGEEDDEDILSDNETTPGERQSIRKGDDSESESDESVVDESQFKLSGGFNWNEDENKENGGIKRGLESESESEEDEQASQMKTKKSKRQKRAAKRAEEEYIHKAELALLDKEHGPESAEDFDRLVLGSPNSSILWIQYMAFHLHAAETDKARAVAEKALKTISFRLSA